MLSSMAVQRSLNGTDVPWTPECWHKSPEQLQEEARAMDIAALNGAVIASYARSDPPAPRGQDRGM